MNQISMCSHQYSLELILALEALAPGLQIMSDGGRWWPHWGRVLELREQASVRYALASRVLFAPVRGAA